MKEEDYLSKISIRIAEIFGLQFQLNQYIDMERRLLAAAKDLKIDNHISGIHEWLSMSHFSNIELNTLSTHLTIGETYFFREKPAFELFIHQIIPELIKQRRGKNEQIKIWSAGCSSGEEPYTLAIILKEHFPELNDWNVKILATDISQIAIQKALVGEYTDWSFREIEPAIKNKYFTPSKKNWSIIPEIKKMVNFSYLNLSENTYPSTLTDTENMDVVFCRNVMMYFIPQVIKDVSARFHESLNENGWLITSQVELNDAYFSNFERVNYSNGLFYQKTNKAFEAINRPIVNKAKSLPVNLKKKVIKKAEIVKTVDYIGKTSLENKPPEKKHAEEVEPVSLFQKGHYLRCIDKCLHNISHGILSNDIFSILVKSYANLGLMSEGEKIIDKIINTNHATPEMYYIYASLLNEQSKLEQTEVNLKKAIYLNHTHVLSHLMLGNVYQKKGVNNLALKHFKTTINLLSEYNDNEIVPESDGITAGRIKELTEQIIMKL